MITLILNYLNITWDKTKIQKNLFKKSCTVYYWLQLLFEKFSFILIFCWFFEQIIKKCPKHDQIAAFIVAKGSFYIVIQLKNIMGVELLIARRPHEYFQINLFKRITHIFGNIYKKCVFILLLNLLYFKNSWKSY